MTVAPRSEDTVRVVWTFGDSPFFTYCPYEKPDTVRLFFDVGARPQVVEAVLDTEFRAHAGRRRAWTARTGAVIFMTWLLVALSLRRLRTTATARLTAPPPAQLRRRRTDV